MGTLLKIIFIHRVQHDVFTIKMGNMLGKSMVNKADSNRECNYYGCTNTGCIDISDSNYRFCKNHICLLENVDIIHQSSGNFFIISKKSSGNTFVEEMA